MPPRLQPPRVAPRAPPSGVRSARPKGHPWAGPPGCRRTPPTPRARPRRCVVPARRRLNAAPRPAPSAAATRRLLRSSATTGHRNDARRAATRIGRDDHGWARPHHGGVRAGRFAYPEAARLGSNAALQRRGSVQREVGAVLPLVACVGATHPTASRQLAIVGCGCRYVANNWGYISRYGGGENCDVSARRG